ncbi:MAG: hypothetical protein QW706_09555, partial [Candidatus Nezhaarchaeales archaeon]
MRTTSVPSLEHGLERGVSSWFQVWSRTPLRALLGHGSQEGPPNGINVVRMSESEFRKLRNDPNPALHVT